MPKIQGSTITNRNGRKLGECAENNNDLCVNATRQSSLYPINSGASNVVDIMATKNVDYEMDLEQIHSKHSN